MGLEIERKYLLNIQEWGKVRPDKSVLIRQAYLVTEPHKTIRIRVTDLQGFLTIKGAATGISRQEFEYEIPLEEANQLINNFTTNSIEKIRHYISYENKTWEVDEFKGNNEGLFVAEIELKTEDEKFSLPDWIGKEVSSDRRYSNSNLINYPYKSW